MNSEGTRSRRSSSVTQSDAFRRNSQNDFAHWGKQVVNLVGAKRRFQHRSSRTGDSFRAGSLTEENSDSARQEVLRDVVIPENLPVAPRFPATMSPEAQFAFLKGYEDLVIKMLKLADPTAGSLPKTSTPTIQQMKMNSLEFAPVEQASRVLGNVICLRDRIDYPSSRPALQQQTPRFIPWEPPIHEPKWLPPIERQLLTSYRLQIAENIVDNLRERLGLINIARPRKGAASITAPVDDFNTWRVNWPRDFEVKPRSELAIRQ